MPSTPRWQSVPWSFDQGEMSYRSPGRTENRSSAFADQPSCMTATFLSFRDGQPCKKYPATITLIWCTTLQKTPPKEAEAQSLTLSAKPVRAIKPPLQGTC